jgi:hypothetical protein
MKNADDPFAALPEEFRDQMASSSPEEIKAEIAKIAMADQDLRQAQKDDQDLADKKEQVKYANEPYKDGFKANRLRISYLKQVLEDKGKA